MLRRTQQHSLGSPDGRRNYNPRLLPTLNSQPWTHAQKAIVDQKAYGVQTAPPWIHPNLSLFNAPADSESFSVSPNPAPVYPVVGAGPIVVIAYTVPRGKIAIVNKMSIVHIGGNPPDFSGEVIWRVLKNGGGIRGLAQLMAQYGTFSAPKDVVIIGIENDNIIVTAECPKLLPNGNPNPGPSGASSTAASFDGFMYPLAEATQPSDGSY
jgi:hypothetical protein